MDSLVITKRISKNICTNINPYYKKIFLRNFQDKSIIGGQNSKYRTLHEQIFAAMFPHLHAQSCFGTGENGLIKWGSKKFTVDFYDNTEKVAYEIDGNSHKTYKFKQKDALKSWFLENAYGIKTVRLTNEEVVNIFESTIFELLELGSIDTLKNIIVNALGLEKSKETIELVDKLLHVT